jgi:hypothetical protein
MMSTVSGVFFIIRKIKMEMRQARHVAFKWVARNVKIFYSENMKSEDNLGDPAMLIR